MTKSRSEYWYIDVDGEIMSKELAWFNQAQDDVGNRFETKEEAEQAVEKLKAWRRVRDKGIKFKKETFYGGHEYSITVCYDDDYAEDLDLLFGGEE